MNLLYSQVEEELRAGVRQMLADRSPPERVLARVSRSSGAGARAEPHDPRLWQTLAGEIGLAGLAVPEARGGAGASWRETAVVLEELGRAVAPVPYLGSAVLATAALLASEDAELLPLLADGGRTAALAVPFAVATAPPVTVHAGRGQGGRGQGGRGQGGAGLNGAVGGVVDAVDADVLLVPADDGLYAVEAADVARTPVVSLDLTRPLCDLVFDRAPGRLVAGGAAARRCVDAALVTGAALLASEQLGVAEWCLATTVGYVRERRQFGRPVGSFQAVKHRLADLWVDVTQARAVARYAAACAADGDADLPVAAALAKAHCSAVVVRAAEECVQLHGGIGFTWEHPAHLYLKRAKSSALALGTADRHRAALAALADLPH